MVQTKDRSENVAVACVHRWVVVTRLEQALPEIVEDQAELNKVAALMTLAYRSRIVEEPGDTGTQTRQIGWSREGSL
jgi:hypothetical protein